MQLLDNQEGSASNYIEVALLELLGRKNIEEITVKEIVNKAGISRSTFYLHFLDKYDLIEKVREALTTSFLSFYQENPTDTSSKTIADITRGICNHVFHYRNFYKHELKHAEYIQQLSSALSEMLMSAYRDKSYAIFASYGTIGYLKYWVENDFPISTEEAAKELMNIGITDWSK